MALASVSCTSTLAKECGWSTKQRNECFSAFLGTLSLNSSKVKLFVVRSTVLSVFPSNILFSQDSNIACCAERQSWKMPNVGSSPWSSSWLDQTQLSGIAAHSFIDYQIHLRTCSPYLLHTDVRVGVENTAVTILGYLFLQKDPLFSHPHGQMCSEICDSTSRWPFSSHMFKYSKHILSSIW